MADYSTSDLEMALASGGLVVETRHPRRPLVENEKLESDDYDEPVRVQRCPPFPLAALAE